MAKTKVKKEQPAVFVRMLHDMSERGEQKAIVFYREAEREAWVTKMHDKSATFQTRWFCRIPGLNDWRVEMKVKRKRRKRVKQEQLSLIGEERGHERT